jgi:hypothetical protein
LTGRSGMRIPAAPTVAKVQRSSSSSFARLHRHLDPSSAVIAPCSPFWSTPPRAPVPSHHSSMEGFIGDAAWQRRARRERQWVIQLIDAGGGDALTIPIRGDRQLASLTGEADGLRSRSRPGHPGRSLTEVGLLDLPSPLHDGIVLFYNLCTGNSSLSYDELLGLNAKGATVPQQVQRKQLKE